MHHMMVSDLFKRVLEKFPVIECEDLNKAKRAWQYYEDQTATKPIGHEALVRLSTAVILNTCCSCAKAVGVPAEVTPEDADDPSTLDWSVLIADGSGVAVEDKSPRDYESHCSDEQVRPLCNTTLAVTASETGFRGIIFKV